jgi:hypothetical protein
VSVDCGVCGLLFDPEDCTCPPGAFIRDYYGNACGPDEDCPVHVTGEHEACADAVDDEIDRRMEA